MKTELQAAIESLTWAEQRVVNELTTRLERIEKALDRLSFLAELGEALQSNPMLQSMLASQGVKIGA